MRHGVLPAVAVFGANASGKTNLLNALLHVANAVRFSHVQLRPDEGVPHTPFELDADSRRGTSRFVVDFVIDGVHYAYEFEHNAERFLAEQLYEMPEGRPRLLYERSGQEFRFGAALKGQKKLISELTRPNSLFLSAAAQQNHEQLKPVFKWLASIRSTRISSDLGFPLFSEKARILRPENRDLVVELLRKADLGIEGMEVQKFEPSTPRTFGDELPQEIFSEKFLASLERTPANLREVRLRHRGVGGSYSLDLEAESRGTKILVGQLETILMVLETGGLWVMDELDASLHPALSNEVIGLFTSQRSNPNRAQILFTTHDASLLGSLRRDEVVLVEKGQDGTSSILSAADFKLRKRDDLRTVYEQGRLGAVPLVGDLRPVVEKLVSVRVEHGPST